MKKILLLLCFLVLVSTASATSQLIVTDDGNAGTQLQTTAGSRVFATTFLNIPPDAENITISAYLSSNLGNTSVYIEIGNTTDFKNVSGDSYQVTLNNLSTGGWYNITVPNTYDFQGNVVARFYDGGVFKFKLGADVSEDSQKKINYYYDGSAWADKTLSWTHFVRLYFDGSKPSTQGTVKVGSYIANTNPTQSSVNGGDVSRSFLMCSNRARIRQNCNITKIQMYVDAVPASTFTVDFWRENESGGYDLIGKTDNLSFLTTGFNTITGLNIPVREGDYYGYSISTGGVYKTVTDTYGTIYYADTSSISETGYDWKSQLNITGRAMNLGLFSDSVDVIFIGDSIIAGHPAHYSYIESYATHTAPNDTISYNFEQLTGHKTQNMGIGGQTTTQIWDRLGTDTLITTPKYVVIEGGVNDVSLGVENATILANVENEIVACRNAGITPVLLLILPWTGGDANETNQVNYLNEQYQAFATEYPGTIIVDARQEVGDYNETTTKWSIKPEYDADGVHFNAAGYAKIAEVLASEVPSTLNADFTANITTGDKPLTVQFTDTSFGVPSSWAWDFTNDGTVDNTTQNPIYTYDTAGNYTVNLTVTNEYGSNTEIKTEYIQVTSGDDFRNLISLINAFINAFKNMRLHVVEAVWQTL